VEIDFGSLRVIGPNGQRRCPNEACR
jgi:hypothetical protein